MAVSNSGRNYAGYTFGRDEAHTKPSMLYLGEAPLKELSRIILFLFSTIYIDFALLMKMLLHFFLKTLDVIKGLQ